MRETYQKVSMGEEKPSEAHLALTKMASADLCLRVAAPPSPLCSGDSVLHCDRQNWTQVAAAYSAVCSVKCAVCTVKCTVCRTYGV